MHLYVCRKWQNAKHSSGSPWVQVLKDLMKNYSSSNSPDLEAETERLGGSSDHSNAGSSDSDPIPDDFMGIKDGPLHEGSSSPGSDT